MDINDGGFAMILQNQEVIHVLLAASILLAFARLFGWIMEKLGSPRVIGEIGAGILLGPTLLEWLLPDLWRFIFTGVLEEDLLLSVLYWLGFSLLMFISGVELKLEWKKEYSRLTATLVLLTTTIPFLTGIIFTDLFHWEVFFGEAKNPLAFSLVMGIAFAVISIPVISKIFFDLGISHTSFAQINLTIAGIHDLFLWVILAFATALVHEGYGSYSLLTPLITTTGFILSFAWFLPNLISRFRWSLASEENSLSSTMILLWVSVSLAGLLSIDMMFGALAAGLFVRRVENASVKTGKMVELLKKVSLSSFIPLYFSLVGFQLDLLHHFPLFSFLLILFLATLIQGSLVWLGAKWMGQTPLTSLNFAAALNARGGPGIVLATVAYQAKIINQDLFAIFVMLSLVTSWIAGTWLRYALHRKWSLMKEE
ncbi:Sodium/hydrogen exchanger [[Clostridium] ultunense Esp]|nr:Sodium/hydrogen exchanger [[Clostridium] ultunense Esp]